MSALTYYRPDGLAANGHSYCQNLRRYGAVCASNHWPLGTSLTLTARSGKHVRLTVCDRVGRGSDYDVDPATFRRLEGGLKKGRGSVRVCRVRRPHKARRRKRHGGGGVAPPA